MLKHVNLGLSIIFLNFLFRYNFRLKKISKVTQRVPIYCSARFLISEQLDMIIAQHS